MSEAAIEREVPKAIRVLEYVLFALFTLTLLSFAGNAIAEKTLNISLQGLLSITDIGLILFCFYTATSTAWRGKHLAMVDPANAKGAFAYASAVISTFISAAVLVALACSMTTLNLYLSEGSGTTLDWKPLLFLVVASIVASLAGMAWHSLRSPFASNTKGAKIAIAVSLAAGAIFGAFISARSLLSLYERFAEIPGNESLLAPEWIVWLSESVSTFFMGSGGIAIAIVIGSAALGTPLFIVLAGVAVTAILGSSPESGISMDGSMLRAFRLFNDSGSIWAFPIFATIGFLLAASGSGERLIKLFSRLFRKAKGGEIVVAVLASTFFATFTGASGITILALGPMLAIMLKGRYQERHAHGVVAASGTLGLLFPPSIAIAIYVYAVKFNVDFSYPLDFLDLYAGALLPGLMMVGATLAAALWLGAKRRLPDSSLIEEVRKEPIGPLLLQALPELLIPVFIAVLVIVRAFNLHVIGAFTIIYILIVEVGIRRSMKIGGFVDAFADHAPIIGGTIIILFSARFLSEFITRADIPTAFTDWITQAIPTGQAWSTFVFLLLLNAALLVVGCFMDIISAIFVVVPLIVPLGGVYGLHPVHLGVVFIMNLCLGFLTPPVGMNLFLASYAFKKPLSKTVVDVLPFFAAQLLILLLITYVPFFSTWVSDLFPMAEALPAVEAFVP
jgi:tripartite ATP-independent transporter DctM subunit